MQMFVEKFSTKPKYLYRMEKITDHRLAWERFHAWVREPENWQHVDRRGRDRIGKAQSYWRAGTLREAGVASLVNEYGRGVYEASAGFVMIVHEDPQ
jgi:hypothetical protein